jgi:MFS transporter, OFA family, oxalate/formate antiporter
MLPPNPKVDMSNQTSSAQGWLVVSAGTAVNLAFGALYAWSMFKAPLTKAPFQLSNAQTAVPYSIACLTFALVMVPAGRMQDRIGPRLVSTVGGVLVGLGFFVASLSKTMPTLAFPMLILGFGILAGAGIGLGYAAASPPAIKWFPPRKKGLIVGIVVGGFGLASVYVAPLTEYLINNYDVAFAFRVLGIVFLLAIVGFSQLLKNPPAGYVPAGAAPAQGAKAAAPLSDLTVGEMLKTGAFYLIWLMFFVGAGAGLMVISFIKTYAKDIPTISLAGFVFVALLAIGNASGRIIAGVLSDKIGRTRTMLIVFLLQAATLVLFSSVTTTVPFAIGSMVIGFCYGACLSLFPSITADFYGLKNLGLNYGIVFSAWGIGALVMAPVAGIIKDSTKSYNAAFYLAAGLLAVGAVISLVVRPPARKQAEETGKAA